MSKRLITDRDVLSGAVRPPLVLDADTLITPSARDRAVRLGWAIVEPRVAAGGGSGTPAATGARNGCPRCGGAGDCPACGDACATAGDSTSARLDALADGLWLVRVEHGQMVSALPASGPGVMRRAANAPAASHASRT